MSEPTPLKKRIRLLPVCLLRGSPRKRARVTRPLAPFFPLPAGGVFSSAQNATSGRFRERALPARHPRLSRGIKSKQQKTKDSASEQSSFPSHSDILAERDGPAPCRAGKSVCVSRVVLCDWFVSVEGDAVKTLQLGRYRKDCPSTRFDCRERQRESK